MSMKNFQCAAGAGVGVAIEVLCAGAFCGVKSSAAPGTLYS
jgi:hypothetical protein